ncbi:HugZ family heme oxygenase [Helicobacter enhydrae]|uniref:HugZ family heme oxygenase n=1 Tax=Helicobacter enhydrae TaxID=222136 RepID=A0A1B1U4U3_9HELI|nr:HugZ family heme oxygenase [Helicobacter enhydrae]ANV97807.1 HugZ family heme oxygenase [Helicobacter enhydrae]
MDFSSIIKHMNDHHQAEMIGLCKKFGNAKEVQKVELESVDFGGLDLVYDGQKLRVEFPQKADAQTIKQAIIDLCTSVPQTLEFDKVKQEIAEFKQEFGSCILATLTKEGFPLSSYSPLIQMEGKNYIYISATAEHFDNIKTNPDKIEVMFLEDECKAKSIIVRKRLRYKAQARFVERGCEEFEKALDHLESSMGGSGGIKTIRNFSDFYLIELSFGSGRFVKGFGQAYILKENGEVEHIGITGNPHGNPHGNPNGNPHQPDLKPQQ